MVGEKDSAGRALPWLGGGVVAVARDVVGGVRGTGGGDRRPKWEECETAPFAKDEWPTPVCTEARHTRALRMIAYLHEVGVSHL